MKNAEGYPDPTAGDAIRACGRMPTHIYLSLIHILSGIQAYPPVSFWLLGHIFMFIGNSSQKYS